MPPTISRYSVATPADDAALRRLLRENPMPGNISLSLEREPSYFSAAAIEGSEHCTIVAAENGRLVCCGSVSVRQRFVNGRPMRVGYLGGLRLDSSCRGRTSILLRGYEFFRKLHEEEGGPPIYFTSILSDNLPARRLLERGLAGMPTYRFLGEVVTLVIGRRKIANGGERMCAIAEPADLPALVEFLNSANQQFQLAPIWSADDLSSPARCPDLRPEDFRLIRSEACRNRAAFCRVHIADDSSVPAIRGPQCGPYGTEGACTNNTGPPSSCVPWASVLACPCLPTADTVPRASEYACPWHPITRIQNSSGTPPKNRELLACAALWDQRSIKQTVIRGYAPWLGRMRPLINVAARILGRPQLPAQGEAIAHAFVSHLAADPQRPQLAHDLVNALLAQARTRGIDFLSIGFDRRDPRLPVLRKAFAPRELISRLYAVHWDDGSELAESLDDRLLGPDVALL